jgi:hypothetical protein
MRTFTTKHTVYNFDELNEDGKQKALLNLCDINVNYDWWDSIYADANMIGLELTGFDLYRGEVNGRLTESLANVCKAIMAEHGDTTPTHQLAVKWQHKHGEDNEAEFLKELLEEYLAILQTDYDYLISEEAIIDAIEANEYEFYEDGRIA